MQLTTNMPLATLFFKHWHTDDTEVGVIVAKARFTRREDGRFRVQPSPPPLAMEDVFEGDPATGYLVAEQDIAPGKAATDILIRGVARSPEGTPREDWPVSVTIPDLLTYGFQVRGPSIWEKRLGRWRLSRPELVQEVPLTYDLAFGGAAPGEDDETPDIYEFNPAGLGYANAKLLAGKDPFKAPQIGELGEFMVADPRAEMTVHGLGPIAKAWLPRRSDAGTFDAEWQAVRHPRMPRDYSLRFWNCAPGPLQVKGYLDGNEELRLTGFQHDPQPLKLALPRAGVMVSLSGEDSFRVAMILDTVVADVRDIAPENHSLDLTWRCMVRDPGLYQVAELLPFRPE